MEVYSLLVSGLGSMPLDEPSAEFNNLVLERIPFPATEPVPVKKSWLSVKLGVVLAGVLTSVSSLGLYLLILDSGRISNALTNGFLRAIGVMEWMSLNSLQGAIDVVSILTDFPILSSIILLGRILLNVVTTTATDPVFALILSAVTMIGIASTVIIAKLMRPDLSGITINGAKNSQVLHFY
jgi:hypothetical protein